MFAAVTKWVLRLGVSVGALALVVYLVPNKHRLLEAAQRISPLVWLSVFGVFVSGQVVMALKWRLLMGPVAPVDRCLQAHFAGQAANLFLPGVSGADVVRLLWVVRAGAPKEHVVVASVVDRLTDLTTLLLLAAGGAIATAQWSGAVRSALAWTALALVAAAAAGIGGLWFARRMFRHALWDRLDAALRQLRREPGRLAAAGLLSLAVQGGYVLGSASLGQAAGVEAGWSAWFVAWPLAKLVALAPISVAGLGVRDMALVFFLEPLGGAEAPVTAAALAWSSILVTSALCGGLWVSLAARDRGVGSVGPRS